MLSFSHRSRALVLAALVACLVAVPLVYTAAPPRALSEAETRAVELDRRIIADAQKNSQLIPTLTYLCDQIGPRLTGTAALNRASQWTSEQMKRHGLANVHLEAWTMPEGWERGKAVARLIDPDNGRSITMASMAWYPGTKGKLQGDVVIIKAQTLKELEAYRGKLKNAIVLSGPPSRLPSLDKLGQPSPGFGRGFAFEKKGAKMNFNDMRAMRRARGEFLAKEGVAAILSDAGKPLGLLVTTGGWQGKERPSASNRVPTLYVAHNHYEMLYRLANRPAPAKTRMEIEVTNKFIPGPLKAFNTIGEIRGSEKPDEVVVVGAHLDSWDLAQGAIDNGTGSSVVLEAARILANCGTKPKRTIRFILFTGEEQGLCGSRAFVEQHKDEMNKISVALVHDTGTGRVRGIGAGGRPAIQAIFDRELRSLQPLGVTNFRGRSLGGSDHASFDRAGVPGMMLSQDPAHYYLSHHTEADTLDRAVEADLIQGAQVMAVTAMRMANLDSLLPRQRDATRGRFGREQ
jgi:hypothetical protein